MEPVPTVSIIIPTYNYADFIGEAIDSVLASNYPQDKIEIVIVDDGSTDHTDKIVAQYGDGVRYTYQKNAGKAAATFTAIQQTRGKYIFNLDADDYFLPEKIEKVVAIFEQDDNIVHVAHPALVWRVDKDAKSAEQVPGSIINHQLVGSDLLHYFYRRNILFGGGSTFAARASVLKELLIPPTIDMDIDEYLVLHTLCHGDSYFIDSPCSVWRVHTNNYSGQRGKSKRRLLSQEAVLNSVLAGNFSPEIESLYLLKYKTNLLTAKESDGQKHYGDIVRLWSYFFENLPLFRVHALMVAYAYRLLNRSVPTGLLDWLRTLKTRRAL